MYLAEKRKLKQKIGDELWNVYKAHKVIVAGGAITSLFCNRDINDVDVYFKSEESLVRLLACFFGKEEYWMTEVDAFSVHVHGLTQRSVMIGKEDNIHQLMWFKYFDSAESIFDSFDFTVCMGAFDFETEEFIFHKDFFKHNSQRYLKFNTGTDFPIMSLLRVDKYRQKGYEISKQEMLRVIFQCTQTPINSWQEAKEHIGGMYGYNMDKTFDQNKDFSIVELIEQLGTLDQRDIELYSLAEKSQDDFYDICKKICPVVAVEDTFIPKSDRYYKCVDNQWKSNWSSYRTKIDYEKAMENQELLSFERFGKIWVLPDPLKPNCYSTDYWVEMELVDGEVAIDKNDPVKCHLVSGAFKVTDLIKRVGFGDGNNREVIQYLSKYECEFDD